LDARRRVPRSALFWVGRVSSSYEWEGAVEQDKFLFLKGFRERRAGARLEGDSGAARPHPTVENP